MRAGGRPPTVTALRTDELRPRQGLRNFGQLRFRPCRPYMHIALGEGNTDARGSNALARVLAMPRRIGTRLRNGPGADGGNRAVSPEARLPKSMAFRAQSAVTSIKAKWGAADVAP